MIIGEEPGLGNWLNRPVVVAALAFVVGAIIAGVVVAIVLSGGDGGGGSTVVRTGTPRATTTPGTSTPAGVTGTPGATVTATPGNTRDPDDALALFVQTQLAANYIGPCPQDTTEGVPEGICSLELYRSDELVTFVLGPPFSEGIGEAVLTRGDDGNWSVDFIELSGDGGLAVGSQAVVFGAGDCLNFRAEPSATGEVLSCQLDGARAAVIGGPEEAGGVTWWQLEGLGWASGQYLLAAP